MNEFEILQLAIDLATKHGKHNQKAHGKRFGADTGGGSGGVATGASGGGGARVRTSEALYDANKAEGALQGYAEPSRNLNNARSRADAKISRMPDGPRKADVDAKVKSILKDAEDKIRKTDPLVGKVEKALKDAKDEGSRDETGVASPSLVKNSRAARSGADSIEKVSEQLSDSANRILDIVLED